ncbi:MAG: THUMP domain-containing protein [Candidatus Nitrosopolaris sp.]
MDFNLIASTYRHREEDAQNELHGILEWFGDPKPASDITELVGILVGRTVLEPIEVVKRTKKLVRNEPWRVRYILRLLPIEFAFIEEGVDSITTAVRRLTSKMKKLETFRITVERRNTLLRSSEIIANVASIIENKVDLENPDWIVLVEIIGKLAGISVIRPDEMFSSVIEKRHDDDLTW